MNRAKTGDKVKVHYTGKFQDGSVFDSSREQQPIEFTIGSGRLIPGFEEGVIGMETGGTKTITVSPEEAYGPRSENLQVDVKNSDLPADTDPLIGEQYLIRQQEGNDLVVTVTDINDDMVTLDANHPLAGKTLTFDIELVEIF